MCGAKVSSAPANSSKYSTGLRAAPLARAASALIAASSYARTGSDSVAP
jgi:hypothetical protein